MREQEHHYEIYELKHGFKIVPSEKNRSPVIVKVDRYGFWRFKDNHKFPNAIPLYSFYSLLDTAIGLLYESWVSPKPSQSMSVTFKITKWAKKVTGKTLSKKVHEIWKNCCNNIDPRISELHRKLYSVSNGSGNWITIEHILKNRVKYRHLINDLLKYPAARIAVLHGDNYVGYGAEVTVDWMAEYAFDGKKYTSLKKTLMNLPYGVSYFQIFDLRGMKLPEPAISRMRLWAYVTLARNFRITSEARKEFAHIIVKSTDEQIKKAIQYIWKYFPTSYTGDFRRSRGIREALDMLFDYPMALGDWDILGLAKRSEQYHHDMEMQERVRQEQRDREMQTYRENQERKEKELLVAKTALPPILLPEDDNIGFLESYVMVQQEGVLMGHCIAQYAMGAIQGKCYLFHVNYKGDQASVEVSPDGFVKQSYGPKDSENEASKYGRRVLGQWAKGLDNKTPVLRTEIYNVEVHHNYAALPLAATVDFPF